MSRSETFTPSPKGLPRSVVEPALINYEPFTKLREAIIVNQVITHALFMTRREKDDERTNNYLLHALAISQRNIHSVLADEFNVEDPVHPFFEPTEVSMNLPHPPPYSFDGEDPFEQIVDGVQFPQNQFSNVNEELTAYGNFVHSFVNNSDPVQNPLEKAASHLLDCLFMQKDYATFLLSNKFDQKSMLTILENLNKKIKRDKIGATSRYDDTRILPLYTFMQIWIKEQAPQHLQFLREQETTICLLTDAKQGKYGHKIYTGFVFFGDVVLGFVDTYMTFIEQYAEAYFTPKYKDFPNSTILEPVSKESDIINTLAPWQRVVLSRTAKECYALLNDMIVYDVNAASFIINKIYNTHNGRSRLFETLFSFIREKDIQIFDEMVHFDELITGKFYYVLLHQHIATGTTDHDFFQKNEGAYMVLFDINNENGTVYGWFLTKESPAIEVYDFPREVFTQINDMIIIENTGTDEEWDARIRRTELFLLDGTYPFVKKKTQYPVVEE